MASTNLLTLLAQSKNTNVTKRVVNPATAMLARLMTSTVPGQLQLSGAGADRLRVGDEDRVIVGDIGFLENFKYAPAFIDANGVPFYGVIYPAGKNSEDGAKLAAIGNSFNLSNSNIHAKLGGNAKTKEVYDILTPVYGAAVLENGEMIIVTSETDQSLPVTQLIAFDASICNFVAVPNAEVVGDIFKENGDFCCPLSFAKSVDKLPARNAAGSGKKTKTTVAVAEPEAELDTEEVEVVEDEDFA